ncbi:hypothetical protein O6H91_12G003300 [Diphasiastrum complanatum]|uniref:Uncharacterized protein n=7 Tax=Diphasiastrum complanatum TaxID=34168 RepID=A0ACC2BYS2_DIPCM|nr:hypothetical protein O6H91_12G003300 [Diphasiastrum complanatum]KAJ7534768.1 hypothetical protein O6H91_12G003300 [Diphasiastrum complanatum]KAJ7534770.1 hypothetical protein O6H91_12G003300 [Diphasiastrum complanatum]KAJ7534771.1 hypothetical protein O6H91_12G003300 [Diphasiastrum complanatum]KAJ7534772.1 hypothetical protein O6H91_12G003300 [Diphasiastrum complanatum]
MFRPMREQVPPPPPPQMRPGLLYPGGPPLNPAPMMNTGQGMMSPAQGMRNIVPLVPPPAPPCPTGLPPLSQPFISPGRAVLLPSFRGALPGFPPLPMQPPPSSPPPLPPSPPAEVPPPPPLLPEDENSSASFAAPPRMPQDPEVVKNIEVLAEFVVRNGPQFEQMTRSKQGADPKFAFLFGGEPGTEAAFGFHFYEWKKRYIFRRRERESSGCASAEQMKANVGAHESKLRENKPVSPAGSDMNMEDDFAALPPATEPKTAPSNSTHGKIPSSQESKHSLEDASSDRLHSERVSLESRERYQAQQRVLATTDVGRDQRGVSPEVHVQVTAEASKSTSIISAQTESSLPEVQQNYECSTEMDEACMEDVSPESSPLKIPEAKPKSDLLHLMSTGFKKNFALRASRWDAPGLANELEVESSPRQADSVSYSDDTKPDVHIVENVETVPALRKDAGSSGTSSSSKEEGLTLSPKSDIRREIEDTRSAFGEDMKQEIGAPTVDEFGRLIRGGSDSDSGEHFPFSSGRSKSRSKSRTPEDSRQHNRSRSRSPRRRIRHSSRSHSRSPGRRRSWSPSPSRDFSRSRESRIDQGPPDRGRWGGQGNRPPLCFDFVKGRCFRGNSCGFLHQENVLAASDSSERWANGNKGGRKETVEEEDGHQVMVEDLPSDKDTREESVHADEDEHSEKKDDQNESVHADEDEHSEKKDDQNESVSPIDEAKPEQMSSTEDDVASDSGRLSSSEAAEDGVQSDLPLHPQKEEIQSTNEEQPLEMSPSGAVPDITKIVPLQAAAPPLASLPSKPLPAIAGFPQQPHEHGFGSNSLHPQQPEFPHNNTIPHQIGLRPPRQPGFTSTSLPPHQSDPLLNRPAPQQPVFSASPWSTFQPTDTGVPRMSQPPALGMNLPAIQSRFDETARMMQQQPGPRPPLPLHQQHGFTSPQVGFPLLGPLSPPPSLNPHQSIKSVPRQEMHMVPGGSHLQPYARNQSPAPVPSPVFAQSQSFTYSTLNSGRVPFQGLPPISPQQQRLSQEPYDPLADGFEPKAPVTGVAVSNPFAAGYQNDSLNSQLSSEKDEIDALEISNRILSAARAGKHVFETVTSKPENGIRWSPPKLENLFASQTLIDKIHSRPLVGANEKELNSPVYGVDDSEDVARAIGERDTDQGQKQSKGKSSKEEKQLKLLRMALTEYVKEVLKPTWREGHLSKEAFKTIAKKAVDKVISTLPNHHIPKGQDKIDRFIISSQEKISRLVQGYLDKYVKP